MYHSLSNYEENTLSPHAHNHDRKKKKRAERADNPWLERMRRRKRHGMGIDAIVVEKEETKLTKVFVNPYYEQSPYLYQFSPYYAEYPYGPDYRDEFGDHNKYLPIYPSYPSTDSTTRVSYRDFPIVKLKVPEYLKEDSMGT